MTGCLNTATRNVALRKESVDRNMGALTPISMTSVALRKESVDRNNGRGGRCKSWHGVALRKESVDRNIPADVAMVPVEQSLSARRAWIEIPQ